MKHLFLSIFIVAMSCLAGTSAQAANKATIVKNSKSNYRIVVAANPLPAEKTAATQLQKYISKITGCTLPIVPDAMPAIKNEILIGSTNRDNNAIYKARENADLEGYAITWQGNKLFVTGSGEFYGRGTLYGVYELLRLMGCEFYATDTETVPHTRTLTIAKLDTTYVPPFENRDTYWSCTYDPEISAKLHLNGMFSKTDRRTLTKQWGGGVSYAGPQAVHTFDKLVPPEKYFESHPEYFSEIGGKRTAKHLYSQLCMTNPEVLHIVIDSVRQWLRNDPESSIVSVSQNDSFVIDSYCTCAKCKAINDAEGSPMGAMLRFVNAVADSIKGEFPHAAVDLLAYQYSITPPSITVPRPNVIVRYCTGACSAHPITGCEQNAGPRHCIETWGRICKRIYIWDYTTNFAQYLCPFPNIHTFGDNIRFFRDNGVKGVFEQGMYQDGKQAGFGDMKGYILAKLLWNPEQNTDTLVNRFMAAYYGAAATHVRRYYDFMHKVIADNGKDFNLIVSCDELYKGLISDAQLNEIDSWWQQAKQAVTADAQALNHVRRTELSFRFYKMCAKRGEFANDFSKAEKQFYADCHELGVERLSEGANIPWVEQ